MNEQHALAHYAPSEQRFVKVCLALKTDVLQNGRFKITSFLTVREQEVLQRIIGNEANLLFYGGIEQSERKIALISEHAIVEYQQHVVVLLLEYQAKFGLLRHQDVLGAILGLGIERKRVGDIVIQDDVIFVALRQSIARYVLESLQSVGKQTVSVRVYSEAVVKQSEQLSEKVIFVSSLRLDSLLSHVLSCSREEAKTKIIKECVQVNGLLKTSYNLSYEVGDVISVRKFGRIYIDSILKTRKERFKITVRST